jgi:hypothetical protein
MEKEKHIRTFDFMYQYIQDECGDGDTIWFTEFIEDVEPNFIQYMNNLDEGWQQNLYKFADFKTIEFRRLNEKIIVTNDLEYFKSIDDYYATLKISG